MVARFADDDVRFKGDGGGEIWVGGWRPTMMDEEEMKAERDDEMGVVVLVPVTVAGEGRKVGREGEGRERKEWGWESCRV